MKLSNTILALVAAIAAAAFTPHQAQAMQITGLLNLHGTATLDNTHLGSAAAVVQFSGVTSAGGNTGSFAGILDGTSVAMTSSKYFFNSSTSTSMFLSVGGFTFDLNTSSVHFQDNTGLIVTGTGTIMGNGFSPTPGAWSFSVTNPAGRPHATFAFQAGVEALPAPDSGMTVALLGLGLIGLAAFRAKYAKS
jgi:VPDSG-CTERM motif